MCLDISVAIMVTQTMRVFHLLSLSTLLTLCEFSMHYPTLKCDTSYKASNKLQGNIKTPIQSCSVAAGHIFRAATEVWWECITTQHYLAIVLLAHLPSAAHKAISSWYLIYSMSKDQPPRDPEYKLFYVVKSRDHHNTHTQENTCIRITCMNDTTIEWR